MAGVTIQACPAGAGMAWLRRGLRLYASRPVPLFLLNTLGFLIALSLDLVPGFGQALALLVFPTIQLVTLTACRTAAAGAAPGLPGSLAPLRVPATRLRMLQVGAVYAIAFGLVALAWPPVGGDTAARPTAPAQSAVPAPAPAPGAQAPAAPAAAAAPAPAEGAAEAAPSPLRVLQLVVTLLVLIPVQMVVLLATALVAWHGLATPKALFFAAFAVWRNRAALLLNLFAMSGLSFVCLLGAVAMLTLVGLAGETVQQLILPILLVLLPVITCSGYSMVQDIVQEADSAAGAAAPDA